LADSIASMKHKLSVRGQPSFGGPHAVVIVIKKQSRTRTVVQECFKGDKARQWKRLKFDPSPHQNPFTDLHKNWHE